MIRGELEPIFADQRTAIIADFLGSIGIEVEPRDLPTETFLPGIAVERGRLLVDERRLSYPGDLLHEAAHIALMPAAVRSVLGGSVEAPGVNLEDIEHAAVTWSYAAALAVGIDPAEVFHGGGYAGRSEGILRTFSVGVYPGIRLLEDARLTAGRRLARELGVPPFPHMLRWLRE